MRKSIFTLAAVFAAANLFGLVFNGQIEHYDKGVAKFSKLAWYADNENTAKLSGKPRKGDSINLRGRVIELDSDIVCGSICINGQVRAEKKKINLTKGSLSTHLGSENEIKYLELKNCLFTAKGGLDTFNIGRPGVANFGITQYRFIDSTATFDGNCILTFNLSNLGNKKSKSGFALMLTGASKVEFKGVPIILDLTQSNAAAQSLFTFAEKDGKLPVLVFSGKNGGTLEKSAIELTVTGKIQSGKYALIRFTKSVKPRGEFASVKINGTQLKLGQSKKIGERTATVDWGVAPTDRDKIANDIVLTLE